MSFLNFVCPFFIFVFPKKAEYAILIPESLNRDRVSPWQKKIYSRLPEGKNV